MAEERRRTFRKPLSLPGGLFHPDGKPICECVMRDISDRGARLKIGASSAGALDQIPEEFILTISKSGNVFRRCKLVWRRNNEVGVHFSWAERS